MVYCLSINFPLLSFADETSLIKNSGCVRHREYQMCAVHTSFPTQNHIWTFVLGGATSIPMPMTGSSRSGESSSVLMIVSSGTSGQHWERDVSATPKRGLVEWSSFLMLSCPASTLRCRTSRSIRLRVASTRASNIAFFQSHLCNRSYALSARAYHAVATHNSQRACNQHTNQLKLLSVVTFRRVIRRSSKASYPWIECSLGSISTLIDCSRYLHSQHV